MRWWWFGVVGCGDGVDLNPDNPNDSDCSGAQDYVAGISATAPSGTVIGIASATPSPPDVGDNTWTLEIRDAGNNPVSGLAPVVTPWMPLHGHGLSPADYAAVEGAPGLYTVAVFDLVMPGLWQFTVTVTDGDAVQFDFCAEG